MRISNHEVIKSGEQELMDAITADLDWGAIENIFKEKHHLGIEENVAFKKGDIVVHNNQIAYQLEFNVNVVLSVLLDRQGKYLSVTAPESLKPPPSDSSEKPGDVSEKTTDKREELSHERIAQMTSQAQEMISDL